MRPFKSYATRWPISLLCILSFGLTLATTVMFTPSVNAQVGISQVAVIDFRNSSKMPGQMFGRMATDAVVLELIRSGKFGVIPSDSLEATMKQLGFDANMNESAMIRLGQEAEASAVISGELLSVKIDKNKKVAEARIAVKMLDVASGELLNGAYGTGVSQPHIGYTADEEKMLVQAIKDAAQNAVETMVSYIIPEATVLNCVGTTEALLNKGAQEGLEPGMEMIVLRRIDGGKEEVVGRIRVTKVSVNDATAAIVKAPRGVKPEDRVRAVYKMPDFGDSGAAAPRKSTRKSLTSGSKLLWGLVALVGLAALFGKGGSQSEAVPGAVAMAGASPDVTARFDDAGILILWDDPGGIGTDNIFEYHVWMDNYSNVHSGASGTLVGPVLSVGRDYAPPLSNVLGSYDHSTVIDTSGFAPFSYSYANENHELTAVEVEVMNGIVVGKTHQFWVSCLYRRLNPSTGAFSWWETTPVPAGRATLVPRPSCILPDQAMDLPLSNITFEWNVSENADLYRIEVSTQPDFDRSHTWCKDVRKVAPPYSITVANELNAAPEFAGVQAGQTLFWRVGARKSVDTPGPVPAGQGSSAAADGPKNTRFIYSDIAFDFTVDAPPGTNPGGDTGGDGDDGGGPPGLPDF